MLERFEHSTAIEIRNGIMFDFYPGLPHMLCVFYICGDGRDFVEWQLAFKWSAKDKSSNYNCNHHVHVIDAPTQACALEIPKVLMGHAHIISCDLSCMGAWDVRLPPVVQSEVTYPNLHLSEPPK